MSQPSDEDDRTIQRQNMAAAIAVAVLVLAGAYLVIGLKRDNALELCLESGRRNCQPLDVETQGDK